MSQPKDKLSVVPDDMNESKDKLHLVRDDTGTVPEPVSSVTPQEEARLLNLADVALNSSTSQGETQLVAGDRTRQEHRNLKNELKDALDKFESDRNSAA